MAKLRAPEVFTPGAYPTHTYVERTDKKYEARLNDALDIPGQVISLSGPSKSGKTVLVERVVGDENLITITGAGISSPEDVWNRILDWMELPSEISRTGTIEGSVAVQGNLTAGTNLPIIAKSELTAGGEAKAGAARGRGKVYQRRGMTQVIEEIAGSDFVVLIDDFHYMPRNVQEEVARQIKEAARRGVKVVTASVPHRSDDVVRANPELRGRVMAIDLDYWGQSSLLSIAENGFQLLRAELNNATLNDFAKEAAGSPQLMQAICLNSCFEFDLRETKSKVVSLPVSKKQRRDIYERTATTTDFRSLVDVLDSGPKTRGTERKTYGFSDGTEGDVYRCILKAISSDPPQLSFTYDEIQARMHIVCTGDEPVGSSIIGSCMHMSRLALDKFPKERVIDWDEQKLVLDIPDPYLLFYLRWSGHLLEPSR
jgi:hypothetical protein